MKSLIVFAACIAACSARILTEKVRGRIVNGNVASRGQIPWQVYLFTTVAHSHFTCGGSLIGNEWVVTAAHCALGATQIDIQLGATRRNETEDGRIWSKASKIIVHPEYNPNTVKNDIALLRLNEPIDFTEYIRPIALAHSNQPTNNGTLVYTSGWGILGKDLPATPYLYYTELSTSTESEVPCNGNPEETIICVLGLDKKSAAQGDSGGPLYQINEDGTPIHIGITSTGRAGYMTPNTFTRTAVYLDFINKNTGLHFT